MADADLSEIMTTTSDGVTVEKSFEPDGFPVPAIAFDIRSDRNERVRVRFAETVPDDVAPENVGFHPKYGAEFWDVDGGDVVFERDFAPGEEYTTVYGLRGDGSDVPEAFLGEPRIDAVVSSPDGFAEPDSPDGVPNGTQGGRIDGGDDVDVDIPTVSEGTPDAGIETVAVDAGGAPDRTGEASDGDASDRTGEAPDGGRPPARPTPTEGEDPLDALVAEIENADPDDPRVATLREALGTGPAGPAIEARISHLQSTVSDLEAYIDALEAFIEENGDGQRLLEEVHEQYEETTERLDELETAVETATESVDTLDSRLEAGLEEVRSDIASVESDTESLSADLSTVIETHDRLSRALGGIGTDDGGDDTPE